MLDHSLPPKAGHSLTQCCGRSEATKRRIVLVFGIVVPRVFGFFPILTCIVIDRTRRGLHASCDLTHEVGGEGEGVLDFFCRSSNLLGSERRVVVVGMHRVERCEADVSAREGSVGV